MTERKKLIEVALPLDAINTESAREKSIRHGHPSTLHLWWARRPLATCRAVIFASLVDDPESEGCPQALLDAIDRLPAPDPLPIGWDALPVAQQRRERLFSFIARLVKWESTTDEHTINTARELIQAATGGNPPPLLDPFCGGGSIPLEAQRLGLEVYASDLNPVAVLITKALVEIPPKFAGQPPVNPDDRKKMGQDVAWKGAAGLAADIRWYGRWMRDRAWERIGHLYPKVRLTPGPSPSRMERGMKSAERKELCRELRQRQTPAEEFFWELVRDRRFDGLKFRRQHPLGRYIADFYCAEHKLAVELDGPVHADQAQRDKARDEALRTYGVRVLRIRNADLLADPEGALERVRREVAAPPAAATPSPSPMERGSGGEATVIAWLWARTVKCPNPACGAQMPLVRSFWLSTKKGKETWVEPIVDRQAKTVRFEVRTGGREAQGGSVNRTGTRCIVCEAVVPFDHVRAEGRAGRMSQQLMAVVAEGQRGRLYLSPTEEQEDVASSASPTWMPDTNLPQQALGFRVQLYGMSRHADLFTPRQLVALTTFSDLVGEARALALEHARASPPAAAAPSPSPMERGPGGEAGIADGGSGATAYADAIATYLAFAVDRSVNRWCTLATWQSSADKVSGTFARQALPMVWDFAEANPFSGSTSNWIDAVEWVAECLDTLPNESRPASVYQLDAAATVPSTMVGIPFTDPPYYDNIGYSDLSDFFYVWLRQMLGGIYPGLLSTVLTPKGQELVATPYRFNGDKRAAERHFEEGLKKAFALLRQHAHTGYPVSIIYAFKQREEHDDGNGGIVAASTAWETMLNGVLQVGFRITGTWPVRTERGVRMLAIGTNALASAIVLTCRPRLADAPMATRREFQQRLRQELPAALRHLMGGHIAPVDLAQAAIGPGMAIFSGYSRVLEADGNAMSVRTALQLINRAIEDYFSEREGELDPDSQFCARWFEQHGFSEGPYGEADVLARAKAIGVEALAREGVLEARGGRVRLKSLSYYRETLAEYDPVADPRPTVWEACHYLIAALEQQGEPGAGRLARRLGGLAEQARDLAYRLYDICDRKGRTEPALGYNSLVASWPEIQRKAAEFARETQGTLGV